MLTNLKEKIRDLVQIYNGFNILAIDLSMRNTGYSIGKIEAESGKYWPKIFDNIVTKKEKNGSRFYKLEAETAEAHKIINTLKFIRDEYNCKLIVVEMPDFSQNSQAAVLIGMLWGLVFKLGNPPHNHLETIEPTALKEWSDSARGDGKDKVTAKVLATIPNFPHKLARNNNVTDAAGIALLVTQIAHNEFKTYKKQANS